MNISKSLAPSLPAASYDELEGLLAALRDVTNQIQVDMVDGVFAPSVSWPFTESNPTDALQKLAPWTEWYEIEVDCMVRQPERYIDTLADIGIKRVVIHAGSTEQFNEIADKVHQHDIRIGLGIMNDTPRSIIADCSESIDYIQVMGIKEIGSQGQPFDERTISTIKELTDLYPALEVAVDGSVNKNTILALAEAGAVRFAPGSAISRAQNPQAAYKHLATLIDLPSEVY